MNRRMVLSGGRYPVLRSLAILYVIGGCVAAIGGIISAIYILARPALGALTDRMFMALASLIGAFFLVITMLAVAEVLKLFIDVEHNTRVNANGKIGMPQTIVTPAEVARADVAGANRLDALDEETAEAALLRGH